MDKELLKGLSEEQVAKVKACKDQSEILKLAKEEGIELSDEQLEAVSGGCTQSITMSRIYRYDYCPKCGVQGYNDALTYKNGRYDVKCRNCGHIWNTH